MSNSNELWPLSARVVLIPIHPQFVEKILLGEKRLEFRRRWPANPVGFILVYATKPIGRIVSLVELGNVIRASKTRLWGISKDNGGGISRRNLFAYMNGKSHGVAIELKRQIQFGDGIHPSALFGERFRPPQSFRYLREDEREHLSNQIGGCTWV